MSEDSLLDDLVRVTREEIAAERSRLDDRWDRLGAGTASADEVAELRALADRSAEAGAAYEAFRPLGADVRRRLVRAIREQDAGIDVDAARDSSEARFRAPWAAVFTRLKLWLAFGGSAAAAAAAAAFMVLARTPALPRYVVADISGGMTTTRAERPDDLPAFAPGDRFELVARPETAVDGGERLGGSCFLARAGEFLRLETDAEVAAGGAMRLRGRLAEDLAPGRWRLWIIVGRPGELPEPAELRPSIAADSTRHRAWVAIPLEIEIRAP